MSENIFNASFMKSQNAKEFTLKRNALMSAIRLLDNASNLSVGINANDTHASLTVAYTNLSNEYLRLVVSTSLSDPTLRLRVEQHLDGYHDDSTIVEPTIWSALGDVQSFLRRHDLHDKVIVYRNGTVEENIGIQNKPNGNNQLL